MVEAVVACNSKLLNYGSWFHEFDKLINLYEFALLLYEIYREEYRKRVKIKRLKLS